ncbi:MAG: putative metal-binding motif-containing protein, partial [Candidatus Nanoarchaeia archaeon]|nr:putative metal-binding motif-containing protein [Candidatus Nanoarchaeia archaeon]
PSDETSNRYCQDNEVYQNLTDFYCQNPGASNSECNSNLISELIENCEYGCENGECLPQCQYDIDCGLDFFSDNYCLNNSVFHDFHDFSCENEQCEEEIIPELAETCDYLCENGECAGECSLNSDCGNESYSEEYCYNGNVVRDHITPLCSDNQCSNETEIIVVDECAYGCGNAQCIEIICSSDSDCNDNNLYTYDECNNAGTANSYCSHTLVNCVTNNDCGPTGFIENEFCSSDDVYKLFQNSTCFNPGLKISICNNTIEQRIIQNCGDDYCDEFGENYCKNGDVYHSRTCYNQGCYEGACTSSNNEEEILVDECENGCSNGECLNQNTHDVAMIDFADSVNGIKIQTLEGEIVNYTLMCNQKYKVWINVENRGDFPENVSFNGSIDGLLFNHNPTNNLIPGDDSLKYKIVNVTLDSGIYDIIVNAIVAIDDNPLNNIAEREIEVVCSVCIDNDNDGYGLNCENGEECDDNDANVHPGAPEICNGIDDNCDGIIDEGCECVDGDTKRCGSSDIGECEYGIQTCSNGEWGACIGNIEPSDEICDLKDNDCDGVIDENNGDCVQGEICDNGECKEITCDYNSDCGIDGYVGDLFCEDNGIYQNYQVFTCNNPGTYESYCTDSITAELFTQCSDNQVCSNAQCVEIECSRDSECDDYNYFTIDTCHNPGTIDSYCTNEPMVCKKSSDCGRDGWVGDLFCSSNNVFQNFITYRCNNPGTSNSYCSHNTNSILVEECESNQVCGNGQCLGITCNFNSDCDDNNLYTVDECNNAGTANSYCSHTLVNCVTNNDCGPTGFIGWEMCSNDDAIKYFQNSTCIDPGTNSSHCEISITEILINDCGEDYCANFGENYCKNGDVYHSRTCYDQGCYEGACFTGTSSVEEELVADCQHGCSNGMCTGECSDDNDCGDESYSDNYCKNGNVVRDHLMPQCTNSLCSLMNQTHIVEECEHGCSNGMCTGECSDDNDCGDESYSDNYCDGNNVKRKHFIPRCINSECSIQEIIETIQICSQSCENGACVSGVHDVALMDFTNSVNKIKLETINGTNILDPVPTLRCGDTIKAKVKVLNKGDFSEDVVVNGNLNGISFSFMNIDDLIPGASTYRSSLFPYIKLNLTAGTYNLNVNAIIPTDNNPLDNSATRQIRIVC